MRWPLCLLLVTALGAADWAEVDGLWFLDAARNRNLGVKVYYPAQGGGPWPIVVFSHGLGGSQWGYRYLGQHWAAHGYVSIHLSHPGSDWLLWDGKGFGEGLSNVRRALADPAVFEARPGDLSFLLDNLALLEAKVPALLGHLDHSRIGVAGHSLGASTALACVGMRAELGVRTGVVFLDRRIRACIAMSPQGLGPFIQAGCWKDIVAPTFLISGDDDEQPLEKGHGLAWRLDAWNGLPLGGKHLLVIAKAEHMTFAEGGLGVHPEPAQLEAVRIATLAFWEAYLRGDGSVPLPEPAGLPTGSRWESR